MVTVDFTEAGYVADEGAGQVEACLVLDIPIATPLIVEVEAVEATPISATGKWIVPPPLSLPL